MNEEQIYEIDVPKAMKSTTITVIPKGRKRVKWRTNIAMIFFRLGAWVAGFGGIELAHGPYDAKLLRRKSEPPPPPPPDDPGFTWVSEMDSRPIKPKPETSYSTLPMGGKEGFGLGIFILAIIFLVKLLTGL